MRKKNIIFALICTLVLLILCGCRESWSKDDIEYIEYKEKKYECFMYMIDNEELLDSIIEELENYDLMMVFYYEDNAVKLAVETTDAQREQILSNEKLIHDLHRLFQNEHIESVAKVKSKGEIEYDYLISLANIAEGFQCSAQLANEPKDVSTYDEHIVGDWFYSEHPNV